MASGTYAAGTAVTPARSREEIERTLTRYGATMFAYLSGPKQVMIAFEAHDRKVRLRLPMPDLESDEFRLTAANRPRSGRSQQDAYDQAVRQRWRALLLTIKAKLQAVETGIVTFEEEFAMHIVLPGGGTVAEQVIPRIAEAYETGSDVPMLTS